MLLPVFSLYFCFLLFPLFSVFFSSFDSSAFFCFLPFLPFLSLYSDLFFIFFCCYSCLGEKILLLLLRPSHSLFLMSTFISRKTTTWKNELKLWTRSLSSSRRYSSLGWVAATPAAVAMALPLHRATLRDLEKKLRGQALFRLSIAHPCI